MVLQIALGIVLGVILLALIPALIWVVTEGIPAFLVAILDIFFGGLHLLLLILLYGAGALSLVVGVSGIYRLIAYLISGDPVFLLNDTDHLVTGADIGYCLLGSALSLPIGVLCLFLGRKYQKWLEKTEDMWS